LIPHLQSSSTLLRRSALKILSASTEPLEGTSLDHDIWSACLNVESSGMTLKNVRERTTNIARVGRLLFAVPKDTSSEIRQVTQNAMAYLLSQLKVNFRPLYSETIKTVASLAPVHGEYLWTLIWDELQKTNDSREATVVDLEWTEPSWIKSRPSQVNPEGDEDEDEIEFRCLSLRKTRSTLSRAWDQTTEVTSVDQADYDVSILSPTRQSPADNTGSDLSRSPGRAQL
jgi:U3 small nucleolar RNA-associated protein 20